MNKKDGTSATFNLPLMMGAIGVVYGDIGTSPLYTLKACFSVGTLLPLNDQTVLGVLSLLFWTLLLIVTTKYVAILLRADSSGEGGILVLMTIALRGTSGRQRRCLTVLGLVGAAMFFGDGVVTPAISVLSAVEGLKIALPNRAIHTAGLAVIILIALFSLQRSGTAAIGKLFGPLMCIWFLAIGAVGVSHIILTPRVLQALHPAQAYFFCLQYNRLAFILLGAVFLAVTGAEALYADLGGFGLRPIRKSWFFLVMPALICNYFGQGALLLTTPTAVVDPFFSMVPSWGIWPMLILATAATIIASQAVISGVFAMAHQAIQLGYCPPLLSYRLRSQGPSNDFYFPHLNWLLCAAVVTVVLGFQTAAHLSSAYGLAVATTMTATSLLLFSVIRRVWNWPTAAVVGVIGLFLPIDLAFLGSNLLKLGDGGWFPLLIGAAVCLVLHTWTQGRLPPGAPLQNARLPFSRVEEQLSTAQIQRKSGTAVLIYSAGCDIVQTVLNQSSQEATLGLYNIFLSVTVTEAPRVPPGERWVLTELNDGFFHIDAYYGFKEDPHIPKLFQRLEAQYGPVFGLADATFVLFKSSSPHRFSSTSVWRQRLLTWLERYAPLDANRFSLPRERVQALPPSRPLQSHQPLG